MSIRAMRNGHPWNRSREAIPDQPSVIVPLSWCRGPTGKPRVAVDPVKECLLDLHWSVHSLADQRRKRLEDS